MKLSSLGRRLEHVRATDMICWNENFERGNDFLAKRDSKERESHRKRKKQEEEKD